MKHRDSAGWLTFGISLLLGSVVVSPSVLADQWFGEPIVTEVEHDFGSDLQVGDLNNDGLDDFVTQVVQDYLLYVFLSDSTAHFTDVDSLPISGAAIAYAYALIDEDHDGYLPIRDFIAPERSPTPPTITRDRV